jgi:hypothetical protein
MRRPCPTGGCCAKRMKNMYEYVSWHKCQKKKMPCKRTIECRMWKNVEASIDIFRMMYFKCYSRAI